MLGPSSSKRSKVSVSPEQNRYPESIFQCSQTAQIITSMIDSYNAWWTDLWMEAGACIRMSIPLRLNETTRIPADNLERFRHVLIPEAKDPLEQAIRDRTWWMAYIVERSCNMSTSWAESLHDSEITVELPVAQSIFDSGVGDLQGAQSFQSPDLYRNHPAQHADGLVMFIKALKLYTDVARFFRQYGRGSHTVAGYLGHPSLRRFLSQINAFRLSFPPHLRRPTQASAMGGELAGSKGLDVDLVAAILVTHGWVLRPFPANQTDEKDHAVPERAIDHQGDVGIGRRANGPVCDPGGPVAHL
jgi:hypothetical protein